MWCEMMSPIAVKGLCSMSDWQSLGVHRYCIVDGIFWLETNGELGAESAHSLVEILIDLQHQRPDCATLVDVRGGISLPASTRKILAGRSGEGSLPLPLAVVGANLPVRAVVTLLMNAIRLVMGRDVPMLFVAERGEAEDWLRTRARERGERVRKLELEKQRGSQ